MKSKRKLTRKELRRRKRRRQVIRNRIIFGAVCLLLFVGLVALLSGIISLITGGGSRKETPTDAEHQTQQVDLQQKTDVPENRVGVYDYDGQRTVSIGTGEMTGMFNPLFSEIEGDRAVGDYTQLRLIVQNESGEWVAGTDVPSLAYEYSVQMEKESGNVIYEFVLKQGLTFSDGEPIDIYDILFNLYVRLDPAYDGPSALRELDIVGLKDYLTQAAGTDILPIEGILAGTKICDDKVQREVVQIAFGQYDVETISQLGFAVVPRHLLIDEKKLEESGDSSGNYGVVFNDASFMDNLKKHTTLPAGAGPYVFSSYEDAVLLTANTSFCLSAPKIGAIVLQPLTEEERITAVQEKKVDYVTGTFTRESLESFTETAEQSGLTYGLYGQPMIGYLGINALEIPDRNVRLALASVMDKRLIYEAYPEGMVRLLDCPADSDSWVYTETEICPFDETGETAIRYLEQSGYVQNDGVMERDGIARSFTFSISSDLENSPAGAMLDQAKQILESIGCDVFISVRDDLVSEVMIGDRSCFFLTRTAEAEPDFYQLYYTGEENESSLLTSVGLDYLRDSGSEEEQAILAEINTLLAQSLNEMTYWQRQAIYREIYRKVAELAVEMPLYQPVSCYIYRDDAWESGQMQQTAITAYAGLDYYIWQLNGK